MNDQKQNALESIPKVKNVDEAFEYVGGNGLYQFLLIMINGFMWIVFAFFFYGQSYTLASPKFLCLGNDGIWVRCPMVQGCKNGILDPDQPNTLALFLGFYCDGLYKETILTTSFFMAGMVFGIVFSWFSDIFGRKNAMLIIQGLNVFGLLLFFTKNYFGIFFGCTIIGAGGYANGIISVIYLTEWGNAHYRNYTGMSVCMFWGFGEIIYTFFAYIYEGWEVQTFYVTLIPTILSFFFLLFLKESPKFLYSKEKYSECENVLNYCAKINKKSKIQLVPFQHEITDDKPLVKKKNYGYIDLFRYRSLRITTLLLAAPWFSIELGYYGAIYTMSTIGGSIYVNGLIMAIFETSSYYVTGYFMKYPRKKLLQFSYFVYAAIAILFIAFPLTQECQSEQAVGIYCYQIYVRMILAGFLRFFVCMSFTVIYVYNNECYPTPVRSIGRGFNCCFGRTGAAISPILTTYMEKFGLSAIPIFGVCCFAGGICFCSGHLKENGKEKLQDYIEEDLKEKQNLAENIDQQISKNIVKENKSETAYSNPDFIKFESDAEFSKESPGLPLISEKN